VNPESIQRVRHSLAFGDREEALLREAAPRLIPEVPRWVDRFYARLVTDPAAMAILHEEARVIRLKRSLNAWFLELFSLPYDAAYERARGGIGRTHVRIAMPQHLMVTAMGGIRRDATDTIAAAWADDPETGRRVVHAFDKALDLELALMLEQYRRRSRELVHEADRALFTERVARRLAAATGSRVDAALCYAELFRRGRDEHERERWFARLVDTLKGVARLGRRAAGAVPSAPGEAEPVAIADLCARALSNVSLPVHTHVDLHVVPPDLTVVLHRAPVEDGVEELLQGAVNRDPSGQVRLAARGALDGGVVFEVSDAGPPWALARGGEGDDALDADGAAALAHADYAVDLHGGGVEPFAPPGGGGGIRLRLKAALGPKETADANLAEDPRRVPP
jgi:hypothetical protein